MWQCLTLGLKWFFRGVVMRKKLTNAKLNAPHNLMVVRIEINTQDQRFPAKSESKQNLHPVESPLPSLRGSECAIHGKPLALSGPFPNRNWTAHWSSSGSQVSLDGPTQISGHGCPEHSLENTGASSVLNKKDHSGEWLSCHRLGETSPRVPPGATLQALMKQKVFPGLDKRTLCTDKSSRSIRQLHLWLKLQCRVSLCISLSRATRVPKESKESTHYLLTCLMEHLSILLEVTDTNRSFKKNFVSLLINGMNQKNIVSNEKYPPHDLLRPTCAVPHARTWAKVYQTRIVKDRILISTQQNKNTCFCGLFQSSSSSELLVGKACLSHQGPFPRPCQQHFHRT